MFNKPHGVLCQFSDTEGRPTLADYIHEPGYYPAGRLDLDSEGLVLLTRDGALQHRISHPQHKLNKHYLVQVEGLPTAPALMRLRSGVQLTDYTARAVAVQMLSGKPGGLWKRPVPVRVRRRIATHWLEVVLNQGKNRQVRRMLAAVNLPVLRLIRTRIGDWSLDGLEPGQVRALNTPFKGL